MMHKSHVMHSPYSCTTILGHQAALYDTNLIVVDEILCDMLLEVETMGDSDKQQCRSCYAYVQYLLNTDIMFFPVIGRWADRMITHLTSVTALAGQITLVAEHAMGNERATKYLYQITRRTAWLVLEIRYNPDKWG
jgi:hypothetical protein